MNIGWLIRGCGVFGSVREAIEIGNALVRRGHSFTYYCDSGKDEGWLPNVIEWKQTSEILTDDLDVLIWSDKMDEPYLSTFNQSKAKLKAFCCMGFDPTIDFITEKVKRVFNENYVIADSQWQLDFLKNHFSNIGVPIGGVNINQFRPVPSSHQFDLIWSGDTRGKKGGGYVSNAIQGFNSGTYFKRGIPQDKMSEFLCSSRIFVDGHVRGGWCNPVMEAMACGLSVVCTETECNSDFAIDGYNCLRVPIGDTHRMRMAIYDLMNDADFRIKLSANSINTAQNYSYDKVVIPVEKWLIDTIPLV